MARFSEQSAKCLKCGARWKRHEDKETDVHFSLSFLEDAIDNVFDRAIIISADSDHVPAVRRVRARLPGVFPADIDKAAASGAPAPSGLSRRRKGRLRRSAQFVYQKGIAYGYQMGLRPQTLYGIADSPVGLAAYFLDHDARSYEMIARVFAGGSEGLTRDDVLDNITLTWLTRSALSGARLYWENKGYSQLFPRSRPTADINVWFSLPSSSASRSSQPAASGIRPAIGPPAESLSCRPRPFGPRTSPRQR